MAIFTWTARGLLRTPESIATPCSVKAKGEYIRCFPRPVFKVAICDLRKSVHSPFDRVIASLMSLMNVEGGYFVKTGGESPPVAPKDPPDALPSGASETAPRSPQSNGISLLCKRYAAMSAKGKEDSFRDFVLDQLHSLGDIRCRAMFGGYGLYLGEDFFGIVYDGRLYFKTDEGTRKKYERNGMGPFAPSETQVLKNYFEVPEEVLEDAEELTVWAREAAARKGKRKAPAVPSGRGSCLLAAPGSLRIQQEDLQKLRHVGNEWHRRHAEVVAGPGVHPVFSQDELFRCTFLEQSSNEGDRTQRVLLARGSDPMVEAFRHRSRSGGAPANASSRPSGPRRLRRLRVPWHVRRSSPAEQKPVPGRVFPDGGVLAPQGGGPGIPGLPGGGWNTGCVIPHVRHGFPHLRQSTRDPQVRGAFLPEYRKSLPFGNTAAEP
jgi:DNA transformation protein